jgi:transposase-like protein
MVGTRRTFAREFKVEAVKLVADQGLSPTEAARKRGITDGPPRKWKQAPEAEADRAFRGTATAPPPRGGCTASGPRARGPGPSGTA